MVAIDETSAIRLGGNVANLINPTWFQTVDQYEADLGALEAELVQAHARYQVFTTTITIRNSKWSR
ncbi:MAG: hypothetical protein WDN28_21330 [Chthoniobacter sp.]